MDARNARICPYCKPNQENDGIHIASSLHKFNYLLFTWNKDRQSLIKNRHNVELSISKGSDSLNHDNKGRHSFKITPSDLFSQGNEIDFRCTILSKRKEPIYLVYANVLLRHTWFSFHDPNNNICERRIELKQNASYSTIVKFVAGETVLVGNYKIPVCFSFETVGSRKDTFHIVREIDIVVAEELSEKIEITESPFKGIPWPRDVDILKSTCKQQYSNNYPIPYEYKKFLINNLEEFQSMDGSDFFTLAEIKNKLDPGNVTESNYQDFWDIILWLEEMKQGLGLQQYNMENVTIKYENGWFELEVPGLAEKRPSIVKGDMVDLRIHEDRVGYRGTIMRVNDSTVEIGSIDAEFYDIVKKTPEVLKDMDVKFVLSRLAHERQHQGVQRVVQNGLVPCLFPPEKVGFKLELETRTLNDGDFFNSTIAQNREQKAAVLKILNATSTPYPYIVFGPPGTGKTVTIVEAILQLKKKTKHHILVCAPSNAACDVITEQLLRHCKDEELLRIVSENVDTSNIHEVVIPYTNYEGDDIFRKVLPETLKHYRIVVTTLILAGRFTGKYHPDVLFIDEAAQASETEACCAIALMEKGNKIILAGDPKQLGPSLSSEKAVEYGFGISLLERLMECDLYTQNNNNYITMLIQNFRNHTNILHIPNKLFYDEKLQAMSAISENDPISKIYVFAKIQELHTKKKQKKRGQPVEFCSLLSKESQEGKSPSYYNMMELQMTIKYVRALLSLEFENEDNSVRQSDIGVVTPYVRQVHKLKVLLKNKGYGDVEVGTTETFQGREKRIIIISTVRAKPDLLLEDHQYKLGFVNNKKRFNVALTRAMSKLIVIGCAHVLATDDKWLEYIEFCESLNGFCGAPFNKRTPDIITDTTKRISNIKKDTQYAS